MKITRRQLRMLIEKVLREQTASVSPSQAQIEKNLEKLAKGPPVLTHLGTDPGKESVFDKVSDHEFPKQMAGVLALEMIKSTRKTKRAARKAGVDRVADFYDGIELLRTDDSRGQGVTELVYTVDLGDQTLKDAWVDSYNKFNSSALDRIMRNHDKTGQYSVGSFGNADGTAIQIGIIDSQTK